MSNQVRITLEQIRASAISQSYRRGERLYHQEAIEECIRRGNEIEALCHGSEPEPYRVWAELGDSGMVASSCTCPYDWEGSCKHTVAMLLTWLHQPERFEVRPMIQELLLSRTKEELMGIITQMVARDPDLQEIIERPVPAATSNQQPTMNLQPTIDTRPFQRELRRALAQFGGWRDRTAENKVLEIGQAGKRFAEQGAYANAAAIYCTIPEECNINDYPTDDEGEYIGAVNDIIDLLEDVIDHLSLGQNEALRHRILDNLVATFIWDVEFGGIGYGDGADDMLKAIIQPGDIPRIRTRLEAAKARQAKREFGSWGVESYEELLADLDTLEGVDPEEILARLRAQDSYQLLVRKLLELQRSDEAIAVIRKHLAAPGMPINALALLAHHGHTVEAIQLAEEAKYDKDIAHWLRETYKARGDREAYLRWQLKRMEEEPTLTAYIELKEAAQAVDKWSTIYPQIVQQLVQKQMHTALTHVYLEEERWELAWQTLEQVRAQPERLSFLEIVSFGPGSLEMKIAQASRHVMPARTIPVYVKHARGEIERRDRKHYAVAASMLSEVKKLYAQLEDREGWTQLVTALRAEFKQMPALQDEFNKARL